MPTVIDALVITLGLDPSEYKKGQKEAAESLKKTENEANATAKRMEASGKQAGSFFSSIKNEVIGLGVAFLGFQAIKNFAVQITNADAATGRFAKNVGQSVSNLNAWEGAIRRAGGTTGDIDAAFKAMSTQIESIAMYGTPGADVLRNMAFAGINISKYFDKATTSTQRLLMAAGAFSHMDPQKAQMLGAGMGFNEKTINLLMMGRKAIEELIAEQKAMNNLGKEDARIAIERQKAWQNLSDTAKGFGRTILNDLTPGLEGIFQALGLIIKGYRLLWDLPLVLSGTPKHPTAPAASRTATGVIGGGLLSIEQKLEGSGPMSVSPKGAIGRNQILPSTAKQYGFDPGRLFDPAYNDQVATAILADLQSRYGNNTDAIFAAYNAGPGAADRFIKAGNNPSVLPLETQRYLSHLHSIEAGRGGGTHTSETNINTINVNAPHATDADGIARNMQDSLRRYDLGFQANSGLN